MYEKFFTYFVNNLKRPKWNEKYFDYCNNLEKHLFKMSIDQLWENKDLVFEMLMANNYNRIVLDLEEAFYNLPFNEELIENIYDNVNKEKLIRTKKIPFEFIEKHIEDFDLNDILHYQQCPMEFLDKIIESKDDYKYIMLISNDQVLSEEFILKHKDKLMWSLLSGKQWLYEYDKSFLKKIKTYIDWNTATMCCVIDIDKLLKINKNIDWYHIAEKYDLNMDFIRKHIKNMPINVLLERYELPEDLLEKYHNDIQPSVLSNSYPVAKLSSQFIKEHKDLFEWETIARISKDLTLEFISDYLLDYGYWLQNNPNLDDNIKKQLKNLERL